ncbi:MAG: GAF domain-containing protein [Cyanobacteria bacterium P01_E01_bin.6]
MQHDSMAIALGDSTVDRFQMLLDCSSDAIAEFDGVLRYTAVNVAWADILGLPANEALNTTNDALAHQFHHLSRCAELCTAIDTSLNQILKTGHSLRIIHSAGCQFFEVTYTAITDHSGTLQRIFAFGRQFESQGKASIAFNSGDQHRDRSQTEFSAAGSQPVSDTAQAIVGAEMPGIAASLQANTVKNWLSENNGRGLEPDQQVLEAANQQAGQLSASSDFLKFVLNSIPQCIFWKDRQSVYLGCNIRWAEMAGLDDPQAVVGMTDNDLPWTDDQKNWYLTCDRQVMETGIPMLGIKQSQRQANGQITLRETSKIPIRDANGEIIGLLGMIDDVTERQHAEELLQQSKAKYKRLAKREELLNQLSFQIRDSLDLATIMQTIVREVRQLLDTDRVVIYEFDSDWHGSVVVEEVVAPWRSVLGIVGADNCFPNMYASLYEQGRVRPIADIRDAGLDPCHQNFLEELQIKASLCVPILINEKLWGLLIAHNCRETREWQEPEIDLLKCLADQVSVAIYQGQLYSQATTSAEQAKHQAQKLELAFQELQQTQTQLIQTEKMSSLGQLVAGIAHEINNPVNFIYGNIAHISGYTEELTELIQLYQEHYPHPVPAIQTALNEVDIEFLLSDVAKIIKSLQLGSERIRQIVLSLRNFSRLDEADVKPADIHEGIDSTLLILQHRLKASPNRAPIQLVKQYEALPKIECYPSQLNQVFMNILSNAIDALESWVLTTADNKVPMTITIATHHVSDRNCVQVRIHNNGSHIDEATLNKLFDPFFTTKPIGKGTGLGLSISQQIITQKHQGKLSCLSSLDEGVEFCIELPIRQMAHLRNGHD